MAADPCVQRFEEARGRPVPDGLHGQSGGPQAEGAATAREGGWGSASEEAPEDLWVAVSEFSCCQVFLGEPRSFDGLGKRHHQQLVRGQPS